MHPGTRRENAAARVRSERTWGQVLDQAAARLRAAGIEGARRDARLLLAAALGIEAARVMAYPERLASDAQVAETARMIARRTRREPVSRILGRREFWARWARSPIRPPRCGPRSA